MIHHLAAGLRRSRSIGPGAGDAARLHLLEPDHQDTVGSAILDQSAGEVDTTRSRGTSVVGVVYRDAGHAVLVENALAGARVAIAEARNTCLDLVVIDLGIKQGLQPSLIAHLRVIPLATGLDELSQTYAEDVRLLLALTWRHGYTNLNAMTLLEIPFDNSGGKKYGVEICCYWIKYN